MTIADHPRGATNETVSSNLRYETAPKHTTYVRDGKWYVEVCDVDFKRMVDALQFYAETDICTLLTNSTLGAAGHKARFALNPVPVVKRALIDQDEYGWVVDFPDGTHKIFYDDEEGARRAARERR